MPRKIIAGSQLPLFPEDIFYVSQKDAAAHLNVSTRTINYWEAMELLHPDLALHKSGKGRKYTPNDMVELRFIKAMVVDQGYSIPSLKEKLEKLESPYYYDPQELYWDLREEQWKTRENLALSAVRKNEKKLRENLMRICENYGFTIEGPRKEEFATALLETIRNSLDRT